LPPLSGSNTPIYWDNNGTTNRDNNLAGRTCLSPIPNRFHCLFWMPCGADGLDRAAAGAFRHLLEHRTSG
jgi:hypothetical protein